MIGIKSKQSRKHVYDYILFKYQLTIPCVVKCWQVLRPKEKKEKENKS